MSISTTAGRVGWSGAEPRRTPLSRIYDRLRKRSYRRAKAQAEQHGANIGDDIEQAKDYEMWSVYDHNAYRQGVLDTLTAVEELSSQYDTVRWPIEA